MKKPLRRTAALSAVALVACVASGLPASLEAQVATSPPLAEVNVSPSAVDFFPNVRHDGAKLTVSGGGKVFAWTFDAGSRPSLGAFDPQGNYLADGTYRWELSFRPDAQTRMGLMSSASSNRGGATEAWRPLSGSFTIRGGAIASPGVTEPGAGFDGGTSAFSGGAGGGFTTHSRGDAIDTDAGGASEASFRAARAQRAPSFGAGLQAPNPSGGADSDAAVMAGFSAEAPAAFVQSAAGASTTAATRKYEPGGKNGRPEREE